METSQKIGKNLQSDGRSAAAIESQAKRVGMTI